MDITPEHIESSKTVGKLKGKPIVEITTTGGLSLIVLAKDRAKFETLGAGPHSAIARHIAEKKERDIMWTELNKSDWVDPKWFQDKLPKYETLTQRIRVMNGDEE